MRRHDKPESWKHPIHARGVRSPQYATSHVRGVLTDKKIQKYIESGFYEMRSVYLSALRKAKSDKEAFARLIYDCEKQDFVTI